jgi:hypothetical protein
VKRPMEVSLSMHDCMIEQSAFQELEEVLINCFGSDETLIMEVKKEE